MTKEQFDNLAIGDTLYSHILTNFTRAEVTLITAKVKHIVRDKFTLNKVFAEYPNGRLEELEYVNRTKENWFTSELESIHRAVHVAKGHRGYYVGALKDYEQRIRMYDTCISELEQKAERLSND